MIGAIAKQAQVMMPGFYGRLALVLAVISMFAGPAAMQSSRDTEAYYAYEGAYNECARDADGLIGSDRAKAESICTSYAQRKRQAVADAPHIPVFPLAVIWFGGALFCLWMLRSFAIWFATGRNPFATP